MASTYLSRTHGTSTNADKCTISFWIKRSGLGNETIISNYSSSAFRAKIEFNNSDQLRYLQVNDNSNSAELVTNRVFRDISAWYSITIVADTSQATSSDRLKFYVNNVQETSFATSSYPAQNLDFKLNQNSVPINIGQNGNSAEYVNGYLTEFVFIDGQALDPTSFGEFDEDTGIWKPIDVSGLTFGTNGFYLDFESSGSLGADVSGNGNNFTVNNLTSIDQTTDTPTNNYATMNPLDVPASNQPTFSEGNLKVVSPSSAGDNNFGGASTIAVSSGKWYIEAKATVGAGGYSRNRIGITGNESTARINNTLGANSYEYFYDSASGNSNAGSYGNSYTTGDIIGIALNLDDNELKFYKNGTVQNSGTAISIDAPSSTSIGAYKIAQSDSSGISGATSTFEFNFGSPPYTISSGNSDANGYGNFEYAVPSGYYALNTKNLAEYG